MFLALQIAIRFLKSSKGQTLLITLGIAVGVSVQVFIGSLIQGLQKDLVDTTIGNRSQITVTSSTDANLSGYRDKMETIQSSDEGISEISFAVDGSGTLITDTDTQPILIRGFDFELAEGIYEINDKLVEGSLPVNANEVIIGIDLKDSLNLSLGDTFDLLIPQVKTTTVSIVGFYDLKAAAINNSWVMTTIPTAQGLLALDDVVTSIEIQVDDVFAADRIGENVKTALGNDVEVVDWKAQNEDLLSGLNGQSTSSIMIQVFVMISVVLGIASVLAISVLQKSKQLGILKAMGIKDRQASMIFLFEGLILGIMGAILGVSLGLGLAYSFTLFAVNPDGTSIINLFIDPSFIALSGVIAVIAATIAAIIPARRSSKLSVIEVIRNG